MSTKVFAGPHSTSHSPVGSPHSSRAHTLHASTGSQDTFITTTRSAKRKSLQTSDTSYLSQNWAETTPLINWDTAPAEAWGSPNADSADVTHRSLVSTIVQEDHLHPRPFDEGSHKYSPASSARNSIQSIPVTTPSLMSSMDSAHDQMGGNDVVQEPSYYYTSAAQPIPGPSHSIPGYPQLTIQTSHLPQPQSPPGTYGAHYQHNLRSSYPPSRDYRYSYEQLQYTSPTLAGPPQAVFSPVLQAPHHDYFQRPPNQLFYPEYVTSPTAAVHPPTTGVYYAAPPQPITWNAPISQPVTHIQSPPIALGGFKRQNNQTPATLLNHNTHYQPVTGITRGPAAPSAALPTQIISAPTKLASHFPSKSVPLPARGRHSARVPSNVNLSHQGSQAIGRHNRREQRDSAPLPRSSLLEEFRNNRNKRWELQEIAGHIVEFSGDQHGSRFIQHKLATAHELTRSMVYREIIPTNIHKLARDVFGNYVLQKLCELGTPDERATIARTLQGHLVQLSLDIYGCRVLQKMIDYLTADDQARWLAELNGHILQCMKDANGNHVIQKFLESPLAQHSVLVTAFQNHVYGLATHPYGCRVLQRCFEHVQPELVRPLLNELHQRTLDLMQDQYGNYVMQFILEKGSPHDRNRTIQNLTGHMLQMSKHKFASNVCEKAILAASGDQRKTLIKEISLQRPDGMNPMITMIKDQFANYVLQRALYVAEGEALDGLLVALRPQLQNMRRYTSNSPFSKHITAVERILGERGIDINAKEYSSPVPSANSDSTTTPTMEVKPPGL